MRIHCTLVVGSARRTCHFFFLKAVWKRAEMYFLLLKRWNGGMVATSQELREF